MIKLRYMKDVVTLRLDADQCIGCGMCEMVCPHRVLSVDSVAKVVDRDACMECGACARNCPVDAIDVESGVGCAYAIIKGALLGTEPDCCPGTSGKPCC